MLPLLLGVQHLADALDTENLMIVDVCRDELYPRAHIPGAIHVSPTHLISGKQPAVGKLPELDKLNSLFSAIGYDSSKHIVAYDDEGGGWAGRFIWTLDVIGHKNYSLLDGGIHAWAAAELPLTDEVPRVSPSEVSLDIDQAPIAEKKDVLASIDNPEVLIWDARSSEEFEGTKTGAARAGHIPGAINLDWLELMDRSANLQLRTDLKELVKDRGLSRGHSVITHCQTHHRSGLTYFAGKLLGLNIKAYHGSWSEWGNDPDTPIENPSQS